MTKFNDDNEELVTIGNLDIPLWQFDIFFSESEKILVSLKENIDIVENNGISKDMVRAAHTLGSICRTIGVENVSALGYALENWLTYWYEHRETYGMPTLLNGAQIVLLRNTYDVLHDDIAAIRKKLFIPERSDLIDRLNQEIENTEITIEIEPEVTEENTSSHQNMDSDDFGWLDNLDDLLSDEITKTYQSTKGLVDPDSLSNIQTENNQDNESDDSDVKKNSKINEFSTDLINDLLQYDYVLLSDDSDKDDLDLDLLPIFIEEAHELFSEVPSILAEWKKENGSLNSQYCGALKRFLHTLKGSGRMAGAMRFGAQIHKLETLLESNELTYTGTELVSYIESIIDNSAQALDFMQGNKHRITTVIRNATTDIIKGKKENKVRDVFNKANKDITKEKSISFLKVSTDSVENISTIASNLNNFKNRLKNNFNNVVTRNKQLSNKIDHLKALINDIEIQAEIQMQSRMEVQNNNFDPLEFDRFTKLQELTRMISESLHDVINLKSEQEKSLDDSDDILNEEILSLEDLQYSLMKIRLVSIHSVSSRLERIVRQACTDANKKARLKINSSTDIDTNILNNIIPSFEHIIRNAIAHGIESPENRFLKGKNEEGLINIDVSQKNNEFVIKISDDGRGINHKIIEKSAIEKGLINPDHNLNEHELNHLIFNPGFSTASEISQLSGRGVGLDVVKDEIGKLGGKIEIDTIIDVGTSFVLSVPAYMAVVSIVPVKVDKYIYAIPANLIKDIVVLTELDVIDAYNKGKIAIGNDLYQWKSLNKTLGIKESNDIDKYNKALVFNNNVVYHVDNIETDYTVIVKPLCRDVSLIHGVMGSAVSKESKPLLLIDPTLIKERSIHDITISQDTVRERPLIMVVDDSITVRKVTEKLLSRNNFDVITAIDGMDALEKLESIKPDIFLLDIEMPRMDGFALTEHIRSNIETKNVPIIMISSRAVEKHQKYAFSIGVNEYLGKPYHEQVLLEKINNFLKKEVSNECY